MKNIIRKVLPLFIILVLALNITACGSKSSTTDLTGTTWVLNSGAQGDTTIDKATLESMFGGEMTYSFESDGKVTLALAGVQIEGSWTQDGNTISLDIQGDTGEMTLDGDTLSIEENGVTVEFVQK